MNFTCVLIISYLTLLSTLTNGVRRLTVPVESTDPNHKIICEEIPPGHLGFGHGIKENYRPYIMANISANIYYDHGTVNYTLYRNDLNDNCSFSFEAGNIIWRIYQVSANEIMFHYEPNENAKIMIVDMTTCTIKDISQNIHELENSFGLDFDQLIHYEDGFDYNVIKNRKRVRVSYDFNGNQIGQPKPFLFEHDPRGDKVDSIRAISSKSHSSNLIAKYSDDRESFLSLLDANGQLIKNINYKDDGTRASRIDVISDSIYAYCEDSPYEIKRIECVQIDEFGNELYRNSTSFSVRSDTVFDLRNLKEGGVVLFTYSDSYLSTNPTIRVIEMRPGKVIEKSYRLRVKLFDGHVVMDFNEDEGHFTVRKIDHYLAFPDNALCWFTFSLPSKFQ